VNQTPDRLKQQLRGTMINKRMSVSESRALAAAQKLYPALQELPGLDGMRTVSGFVAARGEIPMEPLLKALLASGRRLALPRVCRDENLMRFHAVHCLGDLTPGAFGILEPKPSSPVLPEKEIDLVLVPGVAFDRKGGRVGFGKGFYDLSLPHFRPETPRVGVCYTFQLVENAPQVEKDQKVDFLLTDEGLIDCARRP
jgi:5-formyltetrahydrofolate cyclo-ligase